MRWPSLKVQHVQPQNCHPSWKCNIVLRQARVGASGPTDRSADPCPGSSRTPEITGAPDSAHMKLFTLASPHYDQRQFSCRYSL
jgi:hypothetical protein